MSNVFTTIETDAAALFALWPTITAAVKSVEAAATGTNATGAQKAALVTESVIDVLQTVAPNVFKSVGQGKIATWIQNAVTKIVAFLNDIGVFSKSGTTTTVTVTPPAAS
jgi:hypothetical protein